jgi:hypothetical protein
MPQQQEDRAQRIQLVVLSSNALRQDSDDEMELDRERLDCCDADVLRRGQSYRALSLEQSR